MTYKQTLFFIGKSLTINFHEENKNLIRKELESKNFDWEAVIRVSSKHYVLPALYCNFKQASFLQYIPEDLLALMKHITHLNRERNTKIIAQAIEVNALLIKNGIRPIFLKGTGNLLENLYLDSAERMVGDIDFIVAEDEYLKTIEILKKDGYFRTNENLIGFHRHYPRLIKHKSITAIEVHQELLKEKYTPIFNFNTIRENIQKNGEIYILSYRDQFFLTILAHQINDNGYSFKNISLRSAYDSFLISQKIDTKNLTSVFNGNFYEIINCYAAVINLVFNDVKSLTILDTKKKNKYLNDFNTLFFNEKKYRIRSRFKERINRARFNFNLILKALYKKEYAIYVFQKTIEKIKS